MPARRYIVSPRGSGPPQINFAQNGVIFAELTFPTSFQFTGSFGQAPYTWAVVSGGFPAGTALSSSGLLSGTPTAGGIATAQIQITDARSAKSIVVTVRVNVLAAVRITTTSPLPNATQSTPYSATLASAGGLAPYTYARTGGTLDPGLAVTTGGVVQGVPTTPNTYAPVITVTDALGNSAPMTFSLTVASNSGTLPYPITQQLFFPATVTQTAGFQQAVAQLNYVYLSAYGGINAGGSSFKAQMQSIKGFATSLYPGHSVFTGLYQIDNGWFATTSTTNATDPLKTNTLNSSLGWRLQQTPGTYPSGTTSGTLGEVNSGFLTNNDSSGCPSYNFSNVGGVPSASAVKGAPVNESEWCAWYENECWYNGNANAIGAGFSEEANPLLDDIIRDNQFTYARWAGYWESNSTNFSQSNSFGGSNNAQAIAVRPSFAQGAAQAAAMYALMNPALGLSGNVDVSAYYGNTGCPPVVDAPRQGLYKRSNIEAPIGNSFSAGTLLTFPQLLLSCMLSEQCTKNNDPSQVIWNMEGQGNGVYGNWEGTSQSSLTAADWRSARYQIGVTELLRQISGAPSTNGIVWVFDEWNAGLGTPGWLGAMSGSRPIDSSTGAYIPPNAAANLAYNTYGIITIIAAGGVAYLYPAGPNDTTTGLSAVTLPAAALQNGGGHQITYTVTPSGSRPPGVVSGAAFTSLTIQPRDAIFTKP